MQPTTTQLANMAGVDKSYASRYLNLQYGHVPERARRKMDAAIEAWNSDGPTARVYRLLAAGEKLDLFQDLRRTGDSRLSSTIARLRDKLDRVPEFGNVHRMSTVITRKEDRGACHYYINPSLLHRIAPYLKAWAEAANKLEVKK